MKKMRRGIAILIPVLAFCLVLPFLRAEVNERIMVTVLVASNQGTDFNLDNDAYRDQLIKLFSYKSYSQKDQVVVRLERTKREKVSLPGGYELLLLLQDEQSGKLMVQAVIRKGETTYLDTIMSILKPGVAFLGGPPEEGGVLILVLESGI